MKKIHTLAIAGIAAATVILAGLILSSGDSKPTGDTPQAGHADQERHDERAPAKGPHGGQLFVEGDFRLELLLAEEAGEARFRVWLFEKDKPLPPAAAKVSVALSRPTGDKEEIAFAPEKDSLNSALTIAEPHVFDATVTAQAGATMHRFSFVKEEGKVELADEQIRAAGITLKSAAPARIQTTFQLPGEIRFNQDRTAHVVPRVAGVVQSVSADLGQQVKKGQVLAVIASTSLSEQRSELLAAEKRLALAKTTYEREKQLWEQKISAHQDFLQASQVLQEAEIALQNARQKLVALGAPGSAGQGALNRYEIRAPFGGMVVEKHLALGESVKEDASIFTLSDLSSVWAEMVVPAKDLDTVRVGAQATIRAASFESQTTGRVSYVGSLLGEQTRTATARVTLPNPGGAWRPGLFVTVELVAGEVEAPVAVDAEAIQTLGDKPAVFVRVPGGFVAQPVETGRSDGKLVEVIKGLKAGADYAAAGSFIVKAELGKGSAEHEH
ncbi:MAG: efflux transporter periplasmic adaptor subunit [Rhodocyclaceae bacterium]|jgi:cobalt-zinc-cadmium efflux system membrane fusion protein|nr:efflux transporter periplasmic adaptor subunit [Rhodocyclaceae bacterium]